MVFVRYLYAFLKEAVRIAVEEDSGTKRRNLSRLPKIDKGDPSTWCNAEIEMSSVIIHNMSIYTGVIAISHLCTTS